MSLERIAFGLFAFGLLQRHASHGPGEMVSAVHWHREILAGIRSGDPVKACDIFVRCVLDDWKKHNQVEINPAFIPIFPMLRDR
jgi:hypothetical protein